jgi:hypothetical protein
MYCLIRWRAQKLVSRGDQQVLRTHFLLDTRGPEINPRDHTVIEGRLQQ